MKRIHIALAVKDFAASVADYTSRLGVEPCCTVEGAYALWRTDQANLSISVKPEEAGKLRHLGFEDSDAGAFSEEIDSSGFTWERFSADQQRREIVNLWPHAKFVAGSTR